MRSLKVKICSFAAIMALFAVSALAHPNLNGAWTLVPTESDFGGQDVLQSGTVTINEREHHMYIARNFTYDGAAQTFRYSFSTDGAENSTIRNGKAFKSKAAWEGDTLRVKTTDNGITTIELFRLGPGNTLTVSVDRTGHAPVTLVFGRR